MYPYQHITPVILIDPLGLHRQLVTENINGTTVTTDAREDLRVLLNEFNGVLKVNDGKVDMVVFNTRVVITIADYNDGIHLIDDHLHFTYSEFFDLFGFAYEKEYVRATVTKEDERNARLSFAVKESAKGLIIGDVISGWTGAVIGKSAQKLYNNAQKLLGFIDNYTTNTEV